VSVGEWFEQMEVLQRYLSDELATLGIRDETINPRQWRLVAHKRQVPQQNNGFDCGVFTCLFAEYVSNGRPMDFSPYDIEFFRKRIALCIHRGEADDFVYEE
jgi:Ulp1 family protease